MCIWHKGAIEYTNGQVGSKWDGETHMQDRQSTFRRHQPLLFKRVCR
jgi:hypothetical protein